MTAKLPTVVTVPVISPLALLMLRPLGRPLAENTSVSPSGSEPLVPNDTTWPTTLLRFAIGATAGARSTVMVFSALRSGKSLKLPLFTKVQLSPSLLR